MADSYKATVIRNVLVALGVLAVLVAIYLTVIGVSYLVHSHHHHGPSPTVTVTTTG